MKIKLPLLATVLATLGSVSLADAPSRGSVLVFPIHRANTAYTIVNVTNTKTDGNGSVYASYQYVNATPSSNPLQPSNCSIVWRNELLTRGDTVSNVAECHNVGDRGFIVVSAVKTTGGLVSHNYLVGSELVVTASSSVYALMPYSFESNKPEGTSADHNSNGRLDFNNVEYEALPAELYLDSFVGAVASRLVLFGMTGNVNDQITVKMDVFNDNEFPLSYTFSFKCWFEIPLQDLSHLFTQTFLQGTPHDPDELDINCSGIGDFETGWAKIRALTASGPFGPTSNPPILGAVTGGPNQLEGGRLLWGGGENTQGQF